MHTTSYCKTIAIQVALFKKVLLLLFFNRERRGRKVLEVRTMTDEERIQQMENELEVTILFGEEADRKYEEVCRDRVSSFYANF